MYATRPSSLPAVCCARCRRTLPSHVSVAVWQGPVAVRLAKTAIQQGMQVRSTSSEYYRVEVPLC